MYVVHVAADVSSAELIRGLLEGAGIRAMVVGAELATVAGQIPFAATFPKVVVDESNAAEAEALIRKSGFGLPETCVHCGYSLHGLPLARCPECGAAFVSRDAGAAWVCGSCGEESDGQFTACWKCGVERSV